MVKYLTDMKHTLRNNNHQKSTGHNNTYTLCGLLQVANAYFNCALHAKYFAFAIQFSTFNKVNR
jgi:hypothetical protein